MRDAAKSGALDGFVLEYQSYINSPDIKSGYVFTPFGVRHDSPLYVLGATSNEKNNILKKFADFAGEEKYQTLGKQYGFNYLNDYIPNVKKVDGNILSSAQKLWKEKKDGGKPVAAVFVADTSGSMNGAPLNHLKQSLIKGQKYLGRENSIGLVDYSDDVTIDLPIAKYDINQQSKFVGAVNNLETTGNTATYDGIIVAMKMLQDEQKKNKNVKPVIFLLTDGEQNEGHEFEDVKGLIKAYRIPIYTIGYNANTKKLKDTLETISSINEAASINADTEDVVYKIKNLLNVQM
jgi:Ca-activated chloride channel family protein